MAATRPAPFYIYVVCLCLATAQPGSECKLDGALAGRTSILQDALGDLEDKDIDSLQAEDGVNGIPGDEAEVLRRRLEAIEAERALLHRRLGLEADEVAKNMPQDGFADVFDRWVEELAPLLPQLAQELAALLCAGILTYFATKRMATPKKRPTIRIAACSPWVGGKPTMPRRQPCLDLASPQLESNDPADVASPKLESDAPGNVEAAVAKLETTFARPPPGFAPPPGLELQSNSETSLVPSMQLHDDHVDNEQIELSEAEAATSVVDEAVQDGQDIVAECDEYQVPSCAEASISHQQPSEISTCDSESVMKSIESSDFSAKAAPEETEVVHPKPRSTKRKKATKSNTDEKPPEEKVATAEPESELVQQCNPEHELSSDASKPTPNWKVSGLFFWRHWHLFSSASVAASVGDEQELIASAIAESKQASPTVQGSGKAGKRKGKQQGLAPSKRAPEAKHKPLAPSWGLRWPCSLPMTVALLVMLGIVLMGKTFQPTSRSLEAQEQELAERQKLLDELKLRRNGHSLRLALLQLQEFQAQAQGLIETLPIERSKRLQDSRADAAQLQEALLEISDEEFPTVEESFNNVYTGWKRILADAKKLADIDSQMANCAGPVESLPL